MHRLANRAGFADSDFEQHFSRRIGGNFKRDLVTGVRPDRAVRASARFHADDPQAFVRRVLKANRDRLFRSFDEFRKRFEGDFR